MLRSGKQLPSTPVEIQTEQMENQEVHYELAQSEKDGSELNVNLKQDTEEEPTEGNYSLVISVASSTYGDYLTGSTESSLCVEDFEWIY